MEKDKTREQLLEELKELQQKHEILTTTYQQDITDRQLIDDEQRISEATWKLIFDHVPDALYLYDLKGNFIDGNIAAEKLLGYKKEELIGKNFLTLNLLPVKYLAIASLDLAKNILFQSTGPNEYVINKKDGTAVQVEISTHPVKINGRVVGLGIARDISGRIKAQNILLENKKDLQEKVRDLSLLSEITSTFLELTSKDDIYNFLGEKIHQLSGADYLMISEYHEQSQSVAVRQIIGISAFTDKIAHVFGFDYKQVEVPIKDLNEQLTIFNRRKLYRVEGGLYGLTAGKVNQVICKSIETLLGINEIVSTGFVWEGSYFGGVTLSFKKGNHLKNPELIQTIIDQASLALSRKYFEQSLEDSEEKYRMLFESNPHPMWVYDLNTLKFLEVNDMAVEKYGYSRDEFLRLTLKDIRPEDDIPRLLENIQLRIEGIEQSGNWRHRKKDGTMIDVEIISHTIEYEGKHAKLVLALDITERKKAEKSLLKLSLAVEQSPASVIITDTDGNIEYANPKTYEITGYRAEEMLGKNSRIFNSGEKPKSEYQLLWETILSGSTWKGEFHNKKKNGDLYWEQASISPIINEKGETTHYLAVKEDISQRKKAEQIQNVIFNISNAATSSGTLEQLIDRIQKELGTLVDTTNFYLALYDAQTDTISFPFFSDEFDSFKSLPAEKTIIRYVIKTRNSLLADQETIKKLENSGEIGRYGTDSLIWLGVPITINDEVIGVIALQSYTNTHAYDESDKKMLEFIVDQISMSIHRKKVEENLMVALSKAKESDRLKSAFLAVMSHELRTPLNAVIGFSSLIDKELPMDQIVSFAEQINKSGNNLLEIVEGILDLTLLESGQATVKKERFSLVNFMNNLNNMVREEQQILDKQNLEISCTSETSGEPVFIYSDQKKLKQVMTNFLKNALKFTLSGKIEFGYLIYTEDEADHIRFFVKDTGIGIQNDQKSIIFERFRQVDDAYTRKFGGTGIGLAISKQTIELLGGRIGVDSESGKGSIFYFTIPFYSEPKNENVTPDLLQPHTDEKLMNKLKILIVEDDAASSRLLSIVIQKFAKEIISVTNGTEAIKTCRKHPDIDLIMMDISMPEMDGYEATRQIRQFNPNVVIIAQTAFALVGDKEKALKAGCNDYIAKPLKREKLQELIHQYFEI